MTIEKKYKNESGMYIPEVQARSIDSLQTITYIDGIRRFEERASPMRGGGTRINIEHYLIDDEEKQNVLNSYINRYNSITLYFNKQTQLDFKLWDFESYSDSGVLKSKGKATDDRYDRIIFYCYFDLQNGQLKNMSEKTYYNPLSTENEIFFMFRYDDQGQLDWVRDFKNVSWNDGYHASEFQQIGSDPSIDFLWEQHPYYHSTYTFLPIGDL